MIGLFQRKVRGFRVIDVVTMGFLLTLVLGVYLAKAGAGRERAEIAQVERDIEGEQVQMRLLRAEVAHLEQPNRIERLSTQFLGLQPIVAKREVTPEGLPDIARSALVKASVPPAAPIVVSAAAAGDAQ